MRWCKPPTNLPAPEEAPQDRPHKREHFVPKLCHTLGLCVCGEQRDILHISQNLKKIMKHEFWKRKKTKEMSEARRLLEAGLIVLSFEYRPDLKANESDMDEDQVMEIGQEEQFFSTLEKLTFRHGTLAF